MTPLTRSEPYDGPLFDCYDVNDVLFLLEDLVCFWGFGEVNACG